MTGSENERLARDYMRAFGAGDDAWWDGHIAPDFVRHDPGLDFEVRGLVGMRRLVSFLHGAFSEIELPVQDAVVQGDRVLLRIRMRGVQTGDFGGVAASGKRFDVDAMDLFHIAEGRIVEQWALMDRPGMMDQLKAGAA